VETFEGALGAASVAADAVVSEAAALAYLKASIPVALVNHSTTYVLTPDVGSALQTQVTRDFFPAWGILASVASRAAKATDWALGIFDTADQAGALGYHDVTPAGLPLGKVFVTVSDQAGVSVSSVLSHELLEMLLDAYVNLLVQDSMNSERFWAYEACDAVEDATYIIGGVEVSDFVIKRYFQPSLALSKPFDYLGILPGPVPALTPGGYMAYLENGQWGEVVGFRRAGRQSGWQGTSRRFYRRRTPPQHSTYTMAA